MEPRSAVAPADPFYVPPPTEAEKAPEVDRERVAETGAIETVDDPVALRARELDEREAAIAQREAELDQRQPREIEHLNDRVVESQIVAEYALCAWDAFKDQANINTNAERALRSTTICVLVLRNGFSIVGSSVAASPEQYNVNEGRKWARSDAMADLWMAEQYSLRNRLSGIDYVPAASERPGSAVKGMEPREEDRDDA